MSNSLVTANGRIKFVAGIFATCTFWLLVTLIEDVPHPEQLPFMISLSVSLFAVTLIAFIGVTTIYGIGGFDGVKIHIDPEA